MTNLNGYSLSIHNIADLKGGNGLTTMISIHLCWRIFLLQNILLKILEVPLQRFFSNFNFEVTLKLQS